jgi:hypothetical protein
MRRSGICDAATASVWTLSTIADRDCAIFLLVFATRSPASTRPRPCPATFDEGVHNMELLAAVAELVLAGGKQVAL